MKRRLELGFDSIVEGDRKQLVDVVGHLLELYIYIFIWMYFVCICYSPCKQIKAQLETETYKKGAKMSGC